MVLGVADRFSGFDWLEDPIDDPHRFDDHRIVVPTLGSRRVSWVLDPRRPLG